MASIGVLEIVFVVLVVAILAAFIVSRTSRPTSLGATGRPPGPTSHVPPRTPLDADTVRSVTDLLAQDQKIQAIKVLRTATGLGLRESKEWVDHWDPSRAGAPDTPPPPSAPGAETDVLAIEARAIARAASKIAAVKHVREQTGWGLAEAKAYVDGLGVE